MLNLNKYFFYIVKFLFENISSLKIFNIFVSIKKILIYINIKAIYPLAGYFNLSIQDKDRYQDREKVKEKSKDKGKEKAKVNQSNPENNDPFKVVDQIDINLLLIAYDTSIKKNHFVPKYKFKISRLNNLDRNQVNLLLSYSIKDTVKVTNPEYAYKLINSSEIKYFNLIKMSDEDSASALASIYKLTGSNEFGTVAREKALRQLKNNIENPEVKKLVMSELRGVLLSNELIKLPIYNNLIPKEKFGLIINYKSLLNEIVHLEQKLRNLNNFKDVLAAEEAEQVVDLERKIVDIKGKISMENFQIYQLVEELLLPYVNNIISQSGVWLGVAGESAGVMGAIAQINKINFQILVKNGETLDPNTPEIIKICEHISIKDSQVPMHYIYLEQSCGLAISGKKIDFHNAPMHYMYLVPNVDIDMHEEKAGFHYGLLRETFMDNKIPHPGINQKSNMLSKHPSDHGSGNVLYQYATSSNHPDTLRLTNDVATQTEVEVEVEVEVEAEAEAEAEAEDEAEAEVITPQGSSIVTGSSYGALRRNSFYW